MPAQAVEELLLQARVATEGGVWDLAKQLYLQALGARSDLPDIHYGLARVYFQFHELTSAAHHFREVARLDPLRAEAFINLGIVLNLLNQFDDAVTALRRGIQIDATRAVGYYNLGLVYRRKGQFDLAVQAYREALRLNPSMGDAHLNLANIYYDNGLYSQAIDHYELSLQARPGWQKAEDALRQAKAVLGAREIGSDPVAGDDSVSAPEGGDQPIDPQVHGAALTTLHQAAIDTETEGKVLGILLQQEIEPLVKELAGNLMRRDALSLEDWLERFNVAIETTELIREQIRACAVRIREHKDRFG
jgi:tetratricopeptide (TPR) repeat protein